MDHQTLITCLIAVTLLTLTPGVDTMLIIRNSARGGWLDGAVSSLGICSGLFVHATVSALGISIILLHTAWAFSALKFAGAAYLIWLGLCSWKRAVGRRIIFAENVARAGWISFFEIHQGRLSVKCTQSQNSYFLYGFFASVY